LIDYQSIYNSGYALNELEKRALLTGFLNEDIGTGDVTSNLLIPEEKRYSAKIICKQDNDDDDGGGGIGIGIDIIVSGLDEAQKIFDICDCTTHALVSEGSSIKKRSDVMIIEGGARSILKAERTALNFLMRMSGISTKTHQFIKKMGEYSKFVAVSSTRKTAPGLRYFDKRAVILGGGISHRIRLDQLVLIKDNHIAVVGSVKKAVDIVKSRFGTKRKIECEVVDFQGILDAIEAGADIVMLDNFPSDLVASSLEKVKELGLRERVIIEVSGGITLENIYDYAKSKPDVISVGSLTHSVHAIDYSLEILQC
jgi:nicotinate-nucleotide pyrophosphorylase (carboxylating)